MTPMPKKGRLGRERASIGGTIDVPDGNGLLIRLDSSTGHVILDCEQEDASFPHIHPNCYAPKVLTDVYLLKGGGSGAAVFHGRHPRRGTIVMKHGGIKETREVFSLAAIADELRTRGVQQQQRLNGTVQTVDMAEFMRVRIPEFVGVYMSPHHLRNRGRELWNTIRDRHTLHTILSNGSLLGGSDSDSSEDEDDEETPQKATNGFGAVVFQAMRNESLNKRDMRISRGEYVGFEVLFRRVILHIPSYTQDGCVIDGYAFLRPLAQELAKEQKIHSWKFTLIQKAIGKEGAVNGAVALTSGKLKGKLLAKVISEFTTVIRNLRALTLPWETGGFDDVLAGLSELQESKDVTSVTKTVDTFCGSAIRKNFLPEIGRFARLREFGNEFCLGNCILTDAERCPASFLGLGLQRGASLERVFSPAPSDHSALDYMEGSWLDLLQEATSFEPDSSAVSYIWTCGLSDAGLHNMFVDEERGIELFDLGEPQVVPQPAFLTKFLMSFFHALGMEEVDCEGGSTWVNRFEVVDGRLSLTKATQELIPYIYHDFAKVMDHFIEDLFQADERVRKLLVRYVVLQLLSDASFCLQRWQERGGGKERFGDRAKFCLQKWLWRALWDLYIASDVHEKLLKC